MKPKKNIQTLSAIAAFAAVIFITASCGISYNEREMPGNTDIYINYGVVTYIGDNGYFEITGDRNELFRVMEYGTPDYVVSLKERVRFNYIIFSKVSNSGSGVFDVKVNGFDNIISHTALPRSYTETECTDETMSRRDSLGNDGIKVTEAMLSGNFINITYDILVPKEKEGKRIINLVYNDRNSDMLILTLYHNAYGAVPGKVTDLVLSTDNFASFEIASLINQESGEIPVRLIWHWYGVQADDLVEDSFEAVYVIR